MLQISSAGLKARDGRVDLASRSLLSGPVGSGKSSVLDALRFGALGFVPTLGARHADTARLMRADAREIDVRVEPEDGAGWWARTLKRVGRDRLSLSTVASWIPAKSTESEHHAAVLRLFGPSSAAAAEALDVRELLNASPAQRAARVQAFLDATGMSSDEAIRLVRAVTALRAVGYTPREIPEDADAVYAVANAVGDRRIRVPDDVAETIARGGIAAAIEAASDRRAHEAWLSREMRRLGEAIVVGDAPDNASIAALAQRIAEIDRIDAIRNDRRAAFEAARADVERFLAESAESVPTISRRFVAEFDDSARELALEPDPPEPEALVVARSDLARLRTAIASRPPVPIDGSSPTTSRDVAYASLSDRRLELKEAEASLDEAEREAEAAPAPEPIPSRPDSGPVVRRMAEVAALVEQLQSEFASSARQLDSVSRWINLDRATADMIVRHRERTAFGDYARLVLHVCEDQFNAARSYHRRHAAIEERITGALHAQREAKARYEEATRADAEWDARRADYEHAVVEHIRRSKAVAEWRAAVAGARGRVQVAEEAVQKAVQEEALRGARRAEAAETEAMRAEAARLAGEVDRMSAEHNAAVAAVRERNARSSVAHEQFLGLRGLVVRGRALIAAEAAAEAEVERTAASDGDKEAVVAEHRAALEARGRADEQRRLLADAEAATEAATLWGHIEWALRRVSEMDVARRSSGLVERIAAFLTAAGRPETPFLRAGSGSVDFGWTRNGAEVTLETLSGGETVLLCAALAGACLSLSDAPLRWLLIEAAELGTMLPALLAGCSAIPDAVTVIVATCVEGAAELAPAGWTTFRFGGE